MDEGVNRMSVDKFNRNLGAIKHVHVSYASTRFWRVHGIVADVTLLREQ